MALTALLPLLLPAWLHPIPAAATPQEHIPGPAGYSVPILDLDGDGTRQVVVDREEGQYLGHVTTTLLDDGKTILAVYPKGHGKGAIVMKRSEDGGRTWSERLPMPENWATSQEVPTLFPIVAPDGTERLIMFSGLAPIRIASSEDQGRTWTPLEPIGDFGGIVACSTTMRLADGSTMALFHDDGRFVGDRHRPRDGNRFHVYAIRSEDGGLSWSTPRVIATHPRAHLCEPLLLRSPDGKRIACLMRENSRQYNSFVSFSDDEGATWSEPQQLSAALTGDRHTGTYAPDGRLFLSFRDTARRSPTQGDWVGWVGTFADLEDGTDGQYRVRLKDNRHRWDCAYPGVELLPDGTFVCTTYGHWEEGEPPYILSTRLKLDELDALAKLSVDTWRIANPPNLATVPVPREGWWTERQALLNKRTEEAATTHGADVIFLGDSITHGWEGAGAEHWESMTSTFSALNLGISGDRTQHVLWRLDHGNLNGLKPKVAVIMIGTNNSNSDPGADIADGIFAILRKLRAEQPQMRILLLDIFPRGTTPDDRLRLINDEANRRIRIAADDPMIDVLGMSHLFLDRFGHMRTELMPDLLHPNEAGYRAWWLEVIPHISRLVEESRRDRDGERLLPVLYGEEPAEGWLKWEVPDSNPLIPSPIPGTDLLSVGCTPFGDGWSGSTFRFTFRRQGDGWAIVAANAEFWSDVMGDAGLFLPESGGVYPIHTDAWDRTWLIVDMQAGLDWRDPPETWPMRFAWRIYLPE